MVVCLLASPLLAPLDIATTRAAAAHAHLHEPREDGKCARDPHESEEGDANLSANVQLSHAADSVAEDDEHDGRDDGGGGNEERVDEGEDGDGEGQPARVDGEGHQEDEDEGEDGAGEEEAEHALRSELDKVENVVDVGREVDW